MPLTIYFSSFQFLQILFVSFICLVIEYSREKGVGMVVMYIVLSFSLSIFPNRFNYWCAHLWFYVWAESKVCIIISVTIGYHCFLYYSWSCLSRKYCLLLVLFIYMCTCGYWCKIWRVANIYSIKDSNKPCVCYSLVNVWTWENFVVIATQLVSGRFLIS